MSESMVTIPLAEYESLKNKAKDLEDFKKGMKSLGVIDYRGEIFSVNESDILRTIITAHNDSMKRIEKVLEYYREVVEDKTGSEMWRLPLNVKFWKNKL